MKPTKLNLKLLWTQFTDVLYPRLRLSIMDRAVYFYLLRHTRLEGKLQLHCSMPWLARGIGISTGPVRESVRRLVALGALRLIQRSKAGHILEVRLPEEIPAVRPGLPAVPGEISVDDAVNALSANLDPSLHPDPFTNAPPPVDLEKLDFLKTRALRNSIHFRERGQCFYCLRIPRAPPRPRRPHGRQTPSSRPAPRHCCLPRTNAEGRHCVSSSPLV